MVIDHRIAPCAAMKARCTNQLAGPPHDLPPTLHGAARNVGWRVPDMSETPFDPPRRAA